MIFTDLPLYKTIQSAIAEKGYTHATPIQEQAIVPILEGKDLLGCAQTGTGKTAAFAIPTLQILLEERNKGNNGGDWSGWKKQGVKCLIVTPTRELAIQIDENIRAYSKGTGLKHTVVFGGVKQHSQVIALKRGVDILTATPGRLLDLMNQGIISLKDLKIFILDEADRMLDMGFVNDIKKIVKELPVKRQSLFFSATMPASIVGLANGLLTNPVRVTVAPVSSAAETVMQKLFFVDTPNKQKLLRDILLDRKIKSVLVFTRTKHKANKIADFINEIGVGAAAIHGNKSQNFRQNALKDFKSGKIKALVATDLASRGIDIDQLSHVINFEIPNEPETYVHRIGRTGRAQNTGIALSFCDATEVGYINDIQRLIGKKIKVDQEHDYHVTHEMSNTQRKRENYIQNSRGGRGNRSRDSRSSGGRSSDRSERGVRNGRSSKNSKNSKNSHSERTSNRGRGGRKR
ncbi:TPA: DEAD/DEAH box helicase [Candidatus Peregrinibacteria bacterium]|nr:DEAD/DEAH box helicase [Candidatus Peregrinibacteria bacterium]